MPDLTYNPLIKHMTKCLTTLGHDDIMPKRLKPRGIADHHWYSYQCKSCKDRFYILDVTLCGTFVLYNKSYKSTRLRRISTSPNFYDDWATPGQYPLQHIDSRAYCKRYRDLA